MNNMVQNISPIIKPQELLALIHHKDIILIDARAGAHAKEKYAANHLKGAKHVDLDSQLADIKPNVAEGGRHPLPSVAQFIQLLTELGITPDAHVIVYDDKNGANAAARFWWMLKAISHDCIQVIDGGMNAAIESGYPLSNEDVKADNQDVKDSIYKHEWDLLWADIAEVEMATQNEQCLIIDVRESGRYNGEFEPIDLIAGHIPSAVNIPYTSNLDTEGYFLSPSELREKYQKALDGKKSEQVIVHCGSGVTACHTLLAMAYAGMEIPKLYVGSWSEWSRNNRPMVVLEDE